MVLLLMQSFFYAQISIFPALLNIKRSSFLLHNYNFNKILLSRFCSQELNLFSIYFVLVYIVQISCFLNSCTCIFYMVRFLLNLLVAYVESRNNFWSYFGRIRIILMDHFLNFLSKTAQCPFVFILNLSFINTVL